MDDMVLLLSYFFASPGTGDGEEDEGGEELQEGEEGDRAALLKRLGLKVSSCVRVVWMLALC